jgi:hypothetical protein
MYAPMPYVLERCIHEIYRDKGWVTPDVNSGHEIFSCRSLPLIELPLIDSRG